MKTLSLILVFLCYSPAFAAEPIEGYWLGPIDPDGNQSTIQIYPCGDKFCGKVSAVTLDSSQYLLGQVILLDLQQESPVSYTKGLIRFDHLSWKFSGSITMDSNDTATLKGCWAYVVCRNVPFTRTSG